MTSRAKLRDLTHTTASGTTEGGVFPCHPGPSAASAKSTTSLSYQRTLLATLSTWQISLFNTPALFTNGMD